MPTKQRFSTSTLCSLWLVAVMSIASLLFAAVLPSPIAQVSFVNTFQQLHSVEKSNDFSGLSYNSLEDSEQNFFYEEIEEKEREDKEDDDRFAHFCEPFHLETTTFTTFSACAPRRDQRVCLLAPQKVPLYLLFHQLKTHIA